MREVDPKTTKRAKSFDCYIDAPMPMVTIFKTIDVTKLLRLAKKGYKFNMLMCYCIVKAAKQISEFKILPIKGKLYLFDDFGVNVIIANKNGSINSCDIPFDDDFSTFNSLYLKLTKSVYEKCENYEIENRMIVGTSSLVRHDIDGVVNMYSELFNNPFLSWGKFVNKGFRKKLKLSFQFHHVQMDGEEACAFLENIQNNINSLKI